MPKAHVLDVDDDEEIRETLVELLEREGYFCFQAANGHSALRKLDELPRPCAVVLDVQMPVLDGQGFLDALHHRSDHRDFPVILISAHPETPKLGRLPGVVSVLMKPFDADELLQLLSGLRSELKPEVERPLDS
jgi:CheY-like chemotaxis protein